MTSCTQVMRELRAARRPHGWLPSKPADHVPLKHVDVAATDDRRLAARSYRRGGSGFFPSAPHSELDISSSTTSGWRDSTLRRRSGMPTRATSTCRRSLPERRSAWPDLPLVPVSPVIPRSPDLDLYLVRKPTQKMTPKESLSRAKTVEQPLLKPGPQA